jgi:hypothetical protein
MSCNCCTSKQCIPRAPRNLTLNSSGIDSVLTWDHPLHQSNEETPQGYDLIVETLEGRVIFSVNLSELNTNYTFSDQINVVANQQYFVRLYSLYDNCFPIGTHIQGVLRSCFDYNFTLSHVNTTDQLGSYAGSEFFSIAVNTSQIMSANCDGSRELFFEVPCQQGYQGVLKQGTQVLFYLSHPLCQGSYSYKPQGEAEMIVWEVSKLEGCDFGAPVITSNCLYGQCTITSNNSNLLM